MCMPHDNRSQYENNFSLFTFSSLICEAEGCFDDFFRLGDPDGLAGGMDTGRDGLVLGGLLRSFTSSENTCT